MKPLRFSIRVIAGDVVDEPRFESGSRSFRFIDGDSIGEFEGDGRIVSTLGALERMMEATILTALTWTFFIGVHAGCVVRDGRSVLLCGDSGAGKSTLTFACGLAGWTVVSDNALYWGDAPHDVLVSSGVPVKLRDGAREMFGRKADARFAMETTARSGPLVFLSRRPGAAVGRRGSDEEALAYLRKYDTRPDRDYAEQRYRVLLQHGVWALEYEHVEDAVAWLESNT